MNLLNSNGIVAILDLHWTDGGYTGNSSGCSSAQATCQKPMPDSAQAIPFWTSVASTFKGDNAVIFDLFNEPYPSRATGSETSGWQCWLSGGTCHRHQLLRWRACRRMVNAVRSTGAANVLMLGGMEYSNDLTQWLQFKPTDPDNNLVASWHSYNFNTCSNQSCWTSQIAPVAASVPVVAGEIGENDCAGSYVNPLMPILDGHRGHQLPGVDVEHVGVLEWSRADHGLHGHADAVRRGRTRRTCCRCRTERRDTVSGVAGRQPATPPPWPGSRHESETVITFI